MKKRKPRSARRNKQPLHATLAERLSPNAMSMPVTINAPPQMPRMPSPPRSTRDIVTLLTALTGLALAARPDADVELLPGTPTTVLVTSAGKARAAFVLPVPHAEACHILGRPATALPDPELDLLWYEEQIAREVNHAG